MKNLLTSPGSKAEDLGLPLPPCEHAVSVCIPTWQQIVGYEEKDPIVMDKLPLGYPRFLLHKKIRDYCTEALQKYGEPGEACLPFPSKAVSERAQGYLKKNSVENTRVLHESESISLLFFPETALILASEYWQHSGEIVSSRAVDQNTEIDEASAEARLAIRKDLASFIPGASSEDVYLFPSGMSALCLALRVVSRLKPDASTVQLGFPYVDSLKIQRKFGSDVKFFPVVEEKTYQELEYLCTNENISAVFVETPTNALLNCIDLPRVSEITKRFGVPLICDDTIGTSINIDPSPYADILVSSLTKAYSGAGDVLAGALLLSPKSLMKEKLKAEIDLEYEDLLWWEDAIKLRENSSDYRERFSKMEKNAAALVEFLLAHPKVSQVNYPSINNKKEFEAIRQPISSGYGILFSFVLAEPSINTASFYDTLQVSKGPSLGTNFTLACPYAQLAHYHELEWAESCGVSRYLVRVSAGLEETDELISRFSSALDTIGQ